MFSCLLIALAFAASWSINTISPMTSATLFNKAFPGDECFMGELLGTSLANVNWWFSFLLSLSPSVYYNYQYICSNIFVHVCFYLFIEASMPLLIPSWYTQHTDVFFGKRVCLLQLQAQHSAVHRWAHCMISLVDATISDIKTVLPTLDSRGEQQRERVDMPLPIVSVCDQAH